MKAVHQNAHTHTLSLVKVGTGQNGLWEQQDEVGLLDCLYVHVALMTTSTNTVQLAAYVIRTIRKYMQ